MVRIRCIFFSIDSSKIYHFRIRSIVFGNRTNGTKKTKNMSYFKSHFKSEFIIDKLYLRFGLLISHFLMDNLKKSKFFQIFVQMLMATFSYYATICSSDMQGISRKSATNFSFFRFNENSYFYVPNR